MSHVPCHVVTIEELLGDAVKNDVRADLRYLALVLHHGTLMEEIEKLLKARIGRARASADLEVPYHPFCHALLKVRHRPWSLVLPEYIVMELQSLSL